MLLECGLFPLESSLLPLEIRTTETPEPWGERVSGCGKDQLIKKKKNVPLSFRKVCFKVLWKVLRSIF